MSGPKNEPSTAQSVMDTELMDTANSPYSNALEVPSAWEALPNAMPCPRELRMRSHFRKSGPRITPEKPAIMTNTTVMEGTPPRPAAI